MTAKRAAIFKPLGIYLAERLTEEMGGPLPEGVRKTTPPPRTAEPRDVVQSKLMQCERCGANVAMLIFAPGATDKGGLEDYARKMYPRVTSLAVPTYVIGPPIGDSPLMERPAAIRFCRSCKQHRNHLNPEAEDLSDG